MAPPAMLRIEADVARLRDVRRFVREVAPGLGADEAAVLDLVQAVDEWVTNVIVHGYRGAGGPIEVELERVGDEIVARVRDVAPAFDPATAPVFDPNLPLERRPAGKMGIHLIRELCDRFEHRVPAGGGNEIAMTRSARPAGTETGGNA
ncbi:MAG TPA: ATP-binding protein [Candidatus Limnocylindrales bacterium]|nr:ATP-binding protein [Candidatus Limnocylindrales bacterium]